MSTTLPRQNVQPQSNNLSSITDSTTAASKKENNTKHYAHAFLSTSLLYLQTSNCGLTNRFPGQRTTLCRASKWHAPFPRNSNRILSPVYIPLHKSMQTSTSEGRVWRKNFSPCPDTNFLRRRTSPVPKCLPRQLAWCNRNNLPFGMSLEQCWIYPHALSDMASHTRHPSSHGKIKLLAAINQLHPQSWLVLYHMTLSLKLC